MKEFILKLCFFIGIVFSILIGLILTPPNKAVYMYEYHKMYQRLDTLSQPRIILIGGSNLSFGTNSKIISDSLHINIQNLGLHAGVGLRFMLMNSIDYLRKGDVVVIKPEYQQFVDVYNGQDDILAEAFFNSRKKWDILNFQQICNIAAGMPKYLWRNFTFTQNGEYQYSALNFNEYGDEIEHWNQTNSENVCVSPIKGKINKEAINEFSDIVREIKQKGIKVYCVWPNSIESNYQLNKRVIVQIEKKLKDRDIVFNSSVHDFVFPDSMAFDTPYHLKYQAVEIASQRLIDICKVIP